MNVIALLFMPLICFELVVRVYAKEHENSMKDLLLNDDDFKKVRDIHRNWYLFSVKSLLAQMAKEFLLTASTESGQKLKGCLRKIQETKDITMTARCLVKAKTLEEKLASSHRLVKLQTVNTVNTHPSHRQNLAIRSRFGKAAKLTWRKRKKVHEEKIKLTKAAFRIKRSPHRLITSSVFKSDTEFPKIISQKTVPPLLEKAPNSPAHRLSNLFVTLFSRETTASELPRRWSTTYKKMVELQKRFEYSKERPGARVYDTRIYDLVLDNQDNEDWSTNANDLPSFLGSAIKLVNSFSGAENTRILSPRLAPLLPEKAKSKGLLSPVLFPFYKDDAEEQILPVPSLLESSGMNVKDRERVLEMIMEVSGAQKAADNAMKILSSLESLEFGDKILNVNEKISASFENLKANLNHDQSKELDSKGFTFMSSKQMKQLHREQGINEPEIKKDVEIYKKLTRAERMDALWEAIADIAVLRKRRSKRQTFRCRRRNRRNRRNKRQALPFFTVTCLRPMVLSPYQFEPVYGLSILGPVILSPNIFSPLIVNPAILGPWVLSPAVPLPFILSPYLLSPYVLSPLVMAPFILTPYVLSPNVINPYVLSPLILSPLVLSPDLLSPMTLGGPVLSPAVLSPSVLSKSYVMASVLSPSVLSK